LQAIIEVNPQLGNRVIAYYYFVWQPRQLMSIKASPSVSNHLKKDN